MIYFIGACAFIFGVIIGSFLNVVILRLHSKPLTGRSMCMSCGKTLTWRELVPIFSFLFQKGRCKGCLSKISKQYILVELLTGIAFCLTALSIFGSLHFSVLTVIQFLLYADIVSILITLSVYDLYHFTIPDIFIWALGVIFVILLSIPGLFPSFSIPAFLAGPVVALPFFLLWVFSSGRWIGFGDVKLALVMGWILGISGGFAMIILGVWIGAIVGIIFAIVTHQKTLKVKIPFGPFLAIGGFLSLLYNIDMSTIIKWFV